MPFCPLCPPDTKQANHSTVPVLEAHIKEIHHITGKQCEICQQSFKKNPALVQHLATKSHHKCQAPKCSLAFMTSTELSKHTRQCHDVGSRDPPASASKPVTTIPVTKFPCASCDTEFTSLEALQHHTSIAHLHRYPCPSCYRIFSSSGALDEHQSTSHPSFSCSSCSQKFSELEALLTHGRLEHSSSSSDASNETVTSHHLLPFSSSHAVPGVQSCPTCKQSFSSIDDLSYHMRTVHPFTITKKTYPCPLCDQAFSKKNKLSAHTITAHPAGPVCTICRLTCPSQQVLNDHVAAVHPKCVKCNIGFMDDAAYSSHCRTLHPEPPRPVSLPGSYSCNSCDRSFKFPLSLDNHKAANHKGAKHKATKQCGMCKFTCTEEGLLQEHITSAHPCPVSLPGSYLCDFCDRSFKFPLSLDNHKAANHKGANHKATKQCGMCKFTCTEERLLQEHITSAHPRPVSPPASYFCSFCDKSFKLAVSLDDHKVAKHPFTCGMCIFACMEEKLLQEHVDLAHPRPVSPPASHFCSFCDKSFKLAVSLDDHKVAKHPFTCGMCIFACMEERLLQEHVDLAHTCPICHEGVFANGGYLLNEHLAGHVTRPVSPPATYLCPCCDKSFKFPLSLDKHLAANHPFTCGMCEFACSEEELLREHIGSAHSCPVCHEGVFANGDLLNEHLVDHVTPYRCEVCQTRYAEEEDLLQHYKDSPDDIHPSCTKCDLGFQDEINYCNHTETVHPQVSCQLCDGALFDPEELPTHYFISRNHPVCDVCQIGFSDQAEFAMHGAIIHPEAYCHLCQWLFESAEALQNHIRHFVAHPKCMDCELRFADTDAYQHHLFEVHRPHFGNAATQDLDLDCLDGSEGERVAYAENRMSSPLTSDRVDPTWGFSGNPDFSYASFVPLPPSTSGYSSPLSQRVLTRSSVGSRSSSRTLSPPPIVTAKDAYMETGYPADHSGSLDVEHSPLSDVPAVGTPLVSSTDFRSPFSPRSETQAYFSPSQQVNGASHSDQESIVSARSPEANSPVIKLPEQGTSPLSSSDWSTLGGEVASRISPKSEDLPDQRPIDVAVPVLRLQVPATNGTSQMVSISGSPSSISPESAGIDISANVTPDYLREARAYLAVTHPQASSTADHSPALASPSLSSIGFTASSSRERRREVRFDDSIMSEPMWDNQSSDSGDSSFDPPVMQTRRKYGIPKRSGASKLPRFAPLRPGRGTGRLNGSIHSGSSTGSLSPYHCRICRRETCEDLTTTTCGHLFCNACITDAVIRDSRCPVCRNAVLLYCLFRIDTTCDT